MAVIVRVRKSVEVELILERAEGEDNSKPPSDLAIRECGTKIRRRNPVTHNEWLVIVSSTGAATFAASVVQAVVAWVNSRNGRRYRVRHGDREYEAPNLREMKKLIKLAGDELSVRILPPDGK